MTSWAAALNMAVWPLATDLALERVFAVPACSPAFFPNQAIVWVALGEELLRGVVPRHCTRPFAVPAGWPGDGLSAFWLPLLSSRIVQVGGIGTKSVIRGAPDSGRPGLSPSPLNRCPAQLAQDDSATAYVVPQEVLLPFIGRGKWLGESPLRRPG